MRPVDHLLRATALAEARHFWFRGFRGFVTPLLRQATKGLSDVRLLDCGCGTGANLELLSQFGARLRVRPDRLGSAGRARGGPDAAGARHGGGGALSDATLRRRHLVRRALLAPDPTSSTQRSLKCTAWRGPAAALSSTSPRWNRSAETIPC